MPYLHKWRTLLKKSPSAKASKWFFYAPVKLSGLCARNMPGGRKKCCTTKHRTMFTKCKTGVIYKIPLTCGTFYIAQTGECVNERLRQHRTQIGAGEDGSLALHCSGCPEKCSPRFADTIIRGHGKTRKAREMLEAFEIARQGDDCASTPSITLTTKESQLLNDCV